LVKEHPDLQITALLRKSTTEFSERYPQVTVVQGDFDSTNVIEKAAAEADIIIRG